MCAIKCLLLCLPFAVARTKKFRKGEGSGSKVKFRLVHKVVDEEEEDVNIETGLVVSFVREKNMPQMEKIRE